MQKVLYNNFGGVLDFSSTNKISSTKRAYFEQIQKYRAKPNRASDSLLARNARHISSKSNARPALVCTTDNVSKNEYFCVLCVFT